MAQGEQRVSRAAVPGVARLPMAAGIVSSIAVAWFAIRYVVDVGQPGAVIGWLLVPVNWVLAALAAAAAARGANGDAVVRRFWYRVSVSCATCGAAAAGTGWVAGSRPGPGSLPIPLAGLYVFSVAILLYALLSLPIPRRPRDGWLTLLLDLGIVVVAGGLLAWFLTSEGASALEASSGSPWVLVALLTAGAAGLVAVAKVALAGAASVDPGAVRVLGGTAFGSAILGGVTTLASERTGVDGGHLLLPLCAFAYLLAADRQRRASAGQVPPRDRRLSFSPLPYVAVVTIDAVLLLVEMRSSAPTQIFAIGSVVLTTLVIVRQLAAFRDNARLLARLDASLAEVGRHENRFRSLLRHSSDIIAITDMDGSVRYASPGVETVLMVTPEEFTGNSIVARTHPEDLPGLYEHGRRLLATPGSTLSYQARLCRPDGSWRWLEIVSTNLLSDPDIRGIVSNARDITEARRYQDELAHQATHDELTGLANRTLFARYTGAALAAGDPEGTVVALVDLDDFKQINDRLGHTVGDALLRAVAQRLLGGVRPQDTVARLGGDEFAVLLREVAPGQCMEIAERLIGELNVPVTADGHDLLVRASVGVAPGEPGVDAGELLRRADVAMYGAKGLGRGRCTRFDPAMDARAHEHSRLAADLSMAVERGEVHLRYQPIVALPSGALSGVEALLRWTHPVRGMVSPAEFIPVAERTGLIVDLGAWVMHEACRQGANWLRRYGSRAPERISVNASARQLIEPDFPATVEAALRASGLPAERLTVEITETAVFDGGPALEAVQAMRAMGVRVALDDFGTGHSSLGLLRTCPVDVLKVDKSFVDGVAQSLEQEAIVTSVRQIGTAMRLQVVAEGVETAQQADRLHVLGYRFAQGFHFARPMTTDEVEAQLTQARGVAAAQAA